MPFLTRLFLFLTALCLAACTSEPDVADTDVVRMPVTIAIPADQFTRDPGDPGSQETFEKPDHIYIYVYLRYTHPDNGAQTYVARLETTLDADKWHPDTEEHIIRYADNLYVDLPAFPRTEGRVYAAVSKGKIPGMSLKKERGSDGNLSGADISTLFSTSAAIAAAEESDLQNIQYVCDKGTDGHRTWMRDLYSTPYNLNGAGGVYYGTIQDITSAQPHCDLVLYHVGARIDVQWTVDEAVQPTTHVSYADVRWMIKQPCYLFRPCENVFVPKSNGKMTGSDKYDEVLINPWTYHADTDFPASLRPDDTPTADFVATQWYGRKVVYAPVFYIKDELQDDTNPDLPADRATKKYMRVQVRLMNNVGLQDDFPYISKGKKGTHVYGHIETHYYTLDSEIYAPWLRFRLNINKTIDNRIP